ncbi:hypothetical protein C8Q74DRAFT_1363711 [Fomes fomentarius]|nr:hypothetical protein C8Q74DRAFT_1363711 [Fomes fomentarius]
MLCVNAGQFRVSRWDQSRMIVSEAVDYLVSPHGMKALLQILYALSKLKDRQQGKDTTAIELLEHSCGWACMDAIVSPGASDCNYREGRIDPTNFHWSFFEDAGLPPPSSLSSFIYAPPSEPYYSSLPSGSDASSRCLHASGFHSTHPTILPVFTYIRNFFCKSLVSTFR